MTGIISLLVTGLWAISLSAETPVPGAENERQPGQLRVFGIDDSDRVLLDGELIGDGRRIMRFGGKLLVNPGDYTFTVLTGDNKLACSSKISIRENSTVVAGCPRPASSQEQQVD